MWGLELKPNGTYKLNLAHVDLASPENLKKLEDLILLIYLEPEAVYPPENPVNISEVDLSGTNLSASRWESIDSDTSSTISTLFHILNAHPVKALNLSNNNLGLLPCDSDIFIQLVQLLRNENLYTLDITKNGLTSDHFTQVAQEVENNSAQIKQFFCDLSSDFKREDLARVRSYFSVPAPIVNPLTALPMFNMFDGGVASPHPCRPAST